MAYHLLQLMTKTFAYELIQSFDKRELREARKWLASPYFNQREDLRQLFELLTDKRGVLNRAQIWMKLFPGQDYDDQHLRLLLSYLYRALEQFLLQQTLEEYEWHVRHLLLMAYRKRGLERHFTKTYHKQQQELNQTNQSHPEYYLARYWQEQAFFQQQASTERTREHNLQNMEDVLTIAFLSMKLRQACWLLAHEAVYKASYQISMEEAIIQTAQKEDYLKYPAIAVYYYCYHMLKEPDNTQHFVHFRTHLFEQVNRFPQEEIRDLFLLAINFCIRQINRTAEDYLQEALELYEKGLTAGLLLENGVLSRFTYNNIAGIALRLQRLDWVEQFLYDYRLLLAKDQQEAAYSLNAARVSFLKKDYQQAIAYLQRADYKDFINNMVAKTILLKCYYELDEYDLLDYHLKTMRSFLRRKRRMGYHQQNYKNIVSFAFRLLSLKPGDKAAKSQLKQGIELTEPLTERKWLLKKVEEL